MQRERPKGCKPLISEPFEDRLGVAEKQSGDTVTVIIKWFRQYAGSRKDNSSLTAICAVRDSFFAVSIEESGTISLRKGQESGKDTVIEG